MDVETGQIHEFKSQELQRLIEEIADEMGFDLTEHRLKSMAESRAGQLAAVMK